MRLPSFPSHRLMLAMTCAAAVLLASSAWHPPLGQSTPLGRFDLRRRAARQAPLPAALREVSGLAVDARGALYAHADERGVIDQLHVSTGRSVLGGARLTHSLNGQPDGLALLGDSLLRIADEAVRRRPTITAYHHVR